MLRLLMLTLALAATIARAQATPPVQAVPSLDLQKYMGTWHEIAKFPNSFQKKCARATTAMYSLNADGTVRVLNRCVKASGDTTSAEGIAKLADAHGPASKLKVRFAPGFLAWLPFVWGDYWVLDITPEYSAVLVGSPNREYLWILSRTPAMDAELYARMVASAKAQGFDVGRIERDVDTGQ
jgi:apolipoprotein D and lipocalin family protein